MSTLRVLFSPDQIHARVGELARAIDDAYPGEGCLHLVGVLRGGFVFISDLVRAIQRPTSVDFVRVSSYAGQTESSGAVTWHLEPDNVQGRDVLIVEDIVDSGLTLDRLRRRLQAQRPSTLKVVSLLDKPGRRRCPVPLDFVGFTIDDPDVFVVGYGLDLDQRYRALPFIAEYRETPS